MPVTKITDAYLLAGAPLVPAAIASPNGHLVPLRGYGGGRILHVCSGGFPGGDRPDNFYTALAGSGGALEALGGRTNKGDLIIVYPGHAETLSAADYMSSTGAASGFSIIGLGSGTQRPTFTWSAAASTWLFDTAGVELANCRLFLAGSTSSTTALTVAAAITVSAASCRVIGNYINFGVDGDQIVTLGIVTTAAGDDFDFMGNFCEGAVAAEITAAGTFLRLVGADRANIAHNYIVGALATDTDGLIEFLTTLSDRVQIRNNFIYACGSGNTCAIDAGADLVNTGFLDWNQLVVDADGTAQTVAFTVHANCNFALGQNNYMVSNNNERGLIVGTATT